MLTQLRLKIFSQKPAQSKSENIRINQKSYCYAILQFMLEGKRWTIPKKISYFVSFLVF